MSTTSRAMERVDSISCQCFSVCLSGVAIHAAVFAAVVAPGEGDRRRSLFPASSCWMGSARYALEQ